ncbi:MAG: MarR family winged helix-turn-helix transcriptional regulator [Christensenellales bacterium]|jgi:DNA-binding MarR family transcriptional regulator
MKRHQRLPEEANIVPDLSSIEDRYYLFGMLTAIANRMQTVGDNVFEEVTWKQWFALLCAGVLQPTPSVSQVAGLVGTSHQNMKQLLLRLQSAGLVSLEKDRSDLRRTLVKLTPAAEMFEMKYRESGSLFMDCLFEGISVEALATARQVINQLDQNLKAIAKGFNRQEDSA